MGGSPTATLVQPTLRLLGTRPLPPALPASEEDLRSGRSSARWVEVTGTIRAVERLNERMKIELLKGKTRLMSFVRHAPEAAFDPNTWVGARARVQGVCANRFDGSRVVAAGLLVPDMSHVVVLEPPVRMTEVPVVAIQAVLDSTVTGEEARRVRVRGTVTAKHGAVSLQRPSVALQDSSGTVVVTSAGAESRRLDDRVEVWAFPAVQDGEVALEDATFLPLGSTNAMTADAGHASTPPESTVLLRQVGEVRSLARAEAEKRLRVHLEGTVTFADLAWQSSFFLQDASGAIYVRGWLEGLQAGQTVEVEGITDPGGIARMVTEATVRRTGTASLPTPLRVDLKALLSEAHDCAWVELEGVVRSVEDQPPHVLLRLVSDQDRFEAPVVGMAGSTLRHLVNARVRLRGVCTGVLNNLDQWTGIRLQVPNPEAIQVLDPGPADPFAVRPRAIRTVNRGEWGLLGLQRVRVRGAVTLVAPGGECHLQDDTGAIQIQPIETNEVRQGASLDVVGFPARDGIRTWLESAQVRPDTEPRQIRPQAVRVEDILPAGQHDRELVAVEGRLLNEAGGSALASLLVQSGPLVFPAQFESTQSGVRFPLWHAGSLVRVSGVCHLQADEQGMPRSFLLRMRDQEDVEVLQAPPWWTPRRSAAMGAGMLTIVAAVLGWVHLLRRQVREKADQIRHRLESQAAAERRLALVWETSAEGMRMTDAEGTIIQVNDAYCRMVDKPRSELEHHPLSVVYAEDQRAAVLDDYRRRFADRTFAPTREHGTTLWNGREMWFEATNSAYEQPGYPPMLLSQFRDITGRKRAEEEQQQLQAQLAHAQKMESVGRLAGGVAHDFNNMLQVILGNVTLALDQLAPDSPLQEDLREIESAAQRSSNMARRLLAFARKQTVSPTVLDLNTTVASMLQMLRRLIGEDIELSWLPGPNLWPVRVDPAQIDQILANLTVNARDAIAYAGKVTLQTANVSVDEADARAHADWSPGEYVMLAVSDSGRGIDAETQAHLFEPFFTTKAIGKGTGLGLATVYGIVKQNHGLLQVHSTPGQGTTFTIYLPRALAPPKSAPLPTIGHSSLRGTETVLLVEDESQILGMVQRVLSARGYTVLTAATPGEAIALAEQHSGPIHLLITDVVMPSMNGRDLEQHIRALKPAIRCLFISGYTADVIAPHGVLEEGVQLLQKPFSADALAAKARELLTLSG